jgi:Cu/Ag efflux pump CusA
VWNSELEISLVDPLRAEEVRAGVEVALGSFPGVTTGVGQPIEHRLSHVLSGTAADVAVEIYHEDQGRLAATTAAVAASLGDVPGTREVNAQRTLTVEGLTVDWNRTSLARIGLTVADVAAQLRAAVHGQVVGRIVEGVARTDLVVRLVRDERRSAQDVRDVELVTNRGARVRADEVATIELEDVPAMLLRQDGRRKAVVTCNVATDANLGGVVDAARERLDPIARVQGAELRFGGQHEAASRGRRRMLLSSLVVAALGMVLLRSTVRSWRAAFVVALNLPLAAVGGVVALYLTVDAPLANLAALARGDGTFVAPVVSLSTLVGFATLFGIALRGGVLLAGRWETLLDRGAPLRDAIAGGVEDRLVPILMTALTAALGLLPVALAGGQPGTELLAPLAVVVLGGLTSSTILNLLVLPAAYALVRGE